MILLAQIAVVAGMAQAQPPRPALLPEQGPALGSVAVAALSRSPVFADLQAPVGPADRWFGDDKLRHFFMSFAATAYAYAGARAVGFDAVESLPVAAGFAAAAGIGKEVHDRRRNWRFSAKDLVWDAAGIGAAVLLLLSAR
jgi:putative lipoprotein